ncbi:NADAR family protein [Streptomyces sp. WMMC500]|uniref:NADAR family protein n=1 Tax=Streptomyces sp. WMMC500 TaxID=3015154 RepID=UPI00248BCA9F|nr:NADAR family protein [Streptomyces sp. WMMC500]WBB64389.1 NADAR family protein [Streptomyces sp. WMMC500]
MRRGRRLKYLFFWGHRARRPGAVDAACLSQWWPAAFTVDGVDYRSAEHWMMAAKARLFGDDVAAERILAARHPGEAKAEGRKVRGFDEAVWAAQRYDLVVRGNVAKFGQSGPLSAYLRGTGDRVLVEASPVDRIWGIGLAPTDDHVADPESWRGLNLLGFALMDARTLLTRQAPAEDSRG